MKKFCLLITVLTCAQVCLFAQKKQQRIFTMQSCVEYAIQNSPYLKSRNLETSIADEDVKINRSRQLPTVNANLSFQLSNQFDNSEKIRSGNIELYQSIWQNERINTLLRLSESEKTISILNYEINRMDLVFITKIQYLELLRLQQLEVIANEMSKRIAVNVESAKERYKVGVSRKSDILKAETEWSNAIFTVNQYSTKRKVAEKNLIKTIGADFKEEITLSNSLHQIEIKYDNWNFEKFYESALNKLPVLKLADESLVKQAFRIDYEKQLASPELGVFAGYSYLDSPMQKDNWFGTAGAKITFNVFSGFERKHKITKEKIRYEQLEFSKIDLVQLIEFEIRQAYLELLESKEQIANSLKQLENSSENLEIVREEYKEGISSMLELLDAENADFEANQNYIEAISDYQIAKITIERKSGIQ